MRRPSARATLLAAALAAALACGALALWPAPADQRRLRSEAMGRWAARGFDAYRVVLAEGECTADYEVRRGQVAWAYEVPCGRGQPRAVEALFAMAAQGERQVAPRCLGPGCPCQETSEVEATYDEALGFPRQIVLRTRVLPAWGSAAFWRRLAAERASPCGGGGERRVRVIALTPHGPRLDP